MKHENQVCSPEQAKRLRDLGILQNKSIFQWFEVSNGDDEGDFNKEGVVWHPVLTFFDIDNGHVTVGPIDADLTTSDGEFCSHRDCYDAFSVAEFAAMMKGLMPMWVEIYQEWGYRENGTPRAYERLAMACAAKLIYLLENNHITAAECNERLQAA